jgi:CRISPR-associated protein Csb1
MIDVPANASRLVVEATLQPVAGSIFQPTGFPDIGAATFERPGRSQADGSQSLLVESVQSMTNHLESLGWDGPQQQPVAALAALPYLAVTAPESNGFLTSSRLEPHRVAAAYVRDGQIEGGEGATWIAQRLGLTPGEPLDWPAIYRAVLELDPLCLIHGVFFSDKRWHGNPRVRRALTVAVEAHGVSPVISGGLKRDDVQITKSEGATSKEGYGFIPFGRTEYTAESIVMTAVLDLEQIRGYGLGEDASQLLAHIALWELVGLLDSPLRLRTACDLEVTDVNIRRPEGFTLPKRNDLATAIAQTSVSFETSGARRLTWQPPKASSKQAA